MKSFRTSVQNRYDTWDKQPPDRTWCHCHTSVKLFGHSLWLHGNQRWHTSVLPLTPWIHELRPRKLYTSVAVTLVPVRVPTQWLLVPSFTSVVG